MDFSVIGLPHYTIWHAYEPSVDDIQHMEVCLYCFLLILCLRLTHPFQQMKREQLAQEQADKEKAEKAMKLKESFGDTTGQWEKDKTELQNIALKEKKEETAAAAAAAVAENKEKVVATEEKASGGKT